MTRTQSQRTMAPPAFAGRKPLGGDASSDLGSVSTLGLHSKYSSMADDGNLSKEKREIATLLSSAERHLNSWEANACIDVAQQALECAKALGDVDAEADALSLKISALRLKSELKYEKPLAALEVAERERADFESKGSQRGSAIMLLAIAELKASMHKEGNNLQEATHHVETAVAFFANSEKMLHAKALLAAVAIYYQRRKRVQCQTAANEALKLFKSLGDPAGEARALHGIALCHAVSEDYDAAAKHASKALAIYQNRSLWEGRRDLEQLRRWEEAFELRVLAFWYMLAEKPAKALRPAKESVMAIRALRRHARSEAVTVLLYIQVLIQNFKEKQALQEAEDCLERFRISKDRVGIISAVEVLMHTHMLLGMSSDADEDALEPLSKARELKDGRLELSVLYSKSTMQIKNKEHEQARETIQEALAVAKSLGDISEEADAHRAVSVSLLTAPGVTPQQISDGKSSALAANDLFKRMGYTGGLASVATLVAYANYLSMQSTDDAAGVWADTLEGIHIARGLYEKAEDPQGESDALCILSQFHLEAQELDEAIDVAESNVELWRELGVKRAQASAMHHLATIRHRAKEYEAAEQDITDARRLCREIGAKGLEANLLLLLTQVLVDQMSQEELPSRKDDPLPDSYVQARSRAFDSIKEALVLAVRSGDSSLRASAQFWRSEVLVWSFRAEEALKSALEAEKSFAQNKDGRGEAHTRVLIADLYLMLGKHAEAKAKAEEALEFAKSSLEGADVEAPAQAVLTRIADKEREQKGSRPRRVGGRTKIVRRLVKKRRKKDGSAVAVPGKGLDVAVVMKQVDEIVKSVTADEDDVTTDTPFMEAGVDSLASVTLVSSLSKKFSVSLAPSIVFDFPTIRSLSENLVSELGSAGAPAAVGGEDEWEEYEEYEDVEVPDDGYADDDIEPFQAIMPVAAAAERPAEQTVAAAAKPKLDPVVAMEKVLSLVKELTTDEDDVTTDSPFMEAGVDSLASVQLVTSVSKQFQMNLAPSVIFDYPTTRALTEYLIEESNSR